MAKVFKDIDAQNRLSDIQAIEAMKQQGIQFVDIAETDLAEWKRIAENARKQIINNGDYSKELIDIISNSLKMYRQQHQNKQAGR
jgi:hypothetical protein